MGITSELMAGINAWTLQSADVTVFIYLTGQFQPDGGADEVKQPTVTAQATAGSAAPSIQWIAGGARVVKIRSSFVAGNFVEDIRPKMDQLRATVQRDPTLGRAPLVTFTWGDLTVTGFVTSLTGKIPGLWVTGLPRSYDFELEVTEVPEVTVKTGSASSGETQWFTLAAGQTFEGLGLRYYGSPLLGEFIRRENPALARDPEAAGDRVKVLEREHPRARGTVQPTAAPFLDRRRTRATWQPVVDALGAARGTSSSVRWEQLAAVASGAVDAAVAGEE